MKQEDRLNIQAWLDGEIAPQKAAQIAEQVGADTDARAVAEELQAVESALKIGEKPVFLDDTREFYWAQIERQINAEEPMPSVIDQPRGTPAETSNLLRWLIPAGSLCAILALMVNFGSRGRDPSDSDQSFDEGIFDSASGQAEPTELLEEENTGTGVGVFHFEGSQGSRNFSGPKDPSALPVSIENPER